MGPQALRLLKTNRMGTGRPLEPHRPVAKTGINKECSRPKQRYGLKREGGWADLVGRGRRYSQKRLSRGSVF